MLDADVCLGKTGSGQIIEGEVEAGGRLTLSPRAPCHSPSLTQVDYPWSEMLEARNISVFWIQEYLYILTILGMGPRSKHEIHLCFIHTLDT